MTRREMVKATAVTGLLGTVLTPSKAEAAPVLAVAEGTVEQTEKIGGKVALFALRNAAQVGWVACKEPSLQPYAFALATRAAIQNKKIRITYESYSDEHYRNVTALELV